MLLTGEKQKYWETKLSQCRFAHHKSHINWPGIEFWPLRLRGWWPTTWAVAQPSLIVQKLRVNRFRTVDASSRSVVSSDFPFSSLDSKQTSHWTFLPWMSSRITWQHVTSAVTKLQKVSFHFTRQLVSFDMSKVCTRQPSAGWPFYTCGLVGAPFDVTPGRRTVVKELSSFALTQHILRDIKK